MEAFVGEGKIAMFWVPDTYVILGEQLPKTSTGKIDKKPLREKFPCVAASSPGTWAVGAESRLVRRACAPSAPRGPRKNRSCDGAHESEMSQEERSRAGRRKGSKARMASSRPKYLDELVFNPDKGILAAPNGNDIVVINRQPLGTVFDGMRQMLQSGSDLIWFRAGVHAGEAEGTRLKKLTSRMSPRDFLRLITDLYTNLGWGKTTFDALDLKGKSVKIFTESNPLTREVSSEQPVCHYIKGFYKGFCTAVFQSEGVTVEETSCEAAGADRCEFRIEW